LQARKDRLAERGSPIVWRRSSFGRSCWGGYSEPRDGSGRHRWLLRTAPHGSSAIAAGS